MASMYVDANRLLRIRPTFSRSLMVSVAVSKLRCTELFFVEPGVKVNGEYYRNVLLMEKMLPAIWGMSSDFFIFQQNSTSSKGHHCVAATSNTKLHWTGTLASKLTRPQSSWLQNLESNTGTRLPNSNTGHRWVEGAPHRCVGRVEPECLWQSYWTGTSLRTSY